MNMTTKHEVLKAHLKEWLTCKKDPKKRGALTKELAKATQMHLKSIGRSMRTLQMRNTRKPSQKRGRKRYYDKQVDDALCELWKYMECPCAETMHPMLGVYIDSAIKNKKWKHDDEATSKVRAVSLGTLKNRVGIVRSKEQNIRGYSSTKPSSVQILIPIRKSHTWVGLPLGYGQTDTVVHCGDRLSGDLVYSLGIVDFATYWAEYTAQWNKGQMATRESIETLVARFPFRIIELHPDTGTEFINHHLYLWTQEHDIKMTRSEPNKKNDNMCIEERNNSIPRRHIGYVRLDDVSLVSLVSEILRVACAIHNHFRPVRRMISKVRVGAKWHRTFEKVAQTPYDRVLLSDAILKHDKAKLRATHATLDPLSLQTQLATLKKALREKLSKISKNNV